jgi:PAS domain S-box-containing protein
MKKDSKLYNILVIEDNPGDLALIEDYLLEQIQTPMIINAKSYSEAQSILESDINTSYDVVLLDLSLPDKSREILITEVLTLSLDCPVIVLTGYSDFDFSLKSLSKGISDYLLKDELNPSALYKSIVYNIERKKILSQLEESEKRYSDIFHLSPEPMWVYDKSSMKFLDVNEAAIHHYGYTKEEFMKMSVWDITCPEDIPMLNDNTDKSSNFKDHGLNNSVRHRKKNGELIQVEIQSNSLSFLGKSAEVILAHDITERIKYIEAIESQNQKLKEISWTQSHVVRAPIARMMGLIEALGLKENSEEFKNELLGYVLSSAYELDNIVRDITEKAEQVNLKRR